MTTVYMIAACSFSIVANIARSYHFERAAASLCGKSLLVLNREMEPSTAEMSTEKAKIKAVYCVA